MIGRGRVGICFDSAGTCRYGGMTGESNRSHSHPETTLFYVPCVISLIAETLVSGQT
jgi:hypothetical protein